MKKILTQINTSNLKKNKLWIICNVLSVLFMLYFIIQIVLPNRIYTFDNSQILTYEGYQTQTPIFNNISLSPGMYKAHVLYQADQDNCGFCSLTDYNVHPKALLAGYDMIYAHKNETDITFWLLESTDTIEFDMAMSNDGTIQIQGLTIEETNGLWTMLLTILLFFTVTLNALILFLEYDKLHPVNKAGKTAFLGVFIISMIASLPFFMDGIITGADLGYHLHRIEAIPSDLVRGVFPTRIASRWVYGQGYADPIFYCNTLLLFPALLRLLGFPLFISYQLFGVAINIATAWIAYYCFKKIFSDYRIGLFCSALYTLSVFRFYKFLIKGALGEGTAQTFFPLILLGFYETLGLSKDKKPSPNAWIHLMLGVAGIFQTHILSTEITVFISVLLCVIYIRQIFRKEIFCSLFKGVAGALILSAWFLVPFLDYYMTENVHIKYVSGRTIQSVGLYPGELMFLFIQTPKSGIEITEGMANKWTSGSNFLLFFGLLFFFALWFSNRLQEKNALTKFTKVCACISALLLLFTQQFFPWDALQKTGALSASLISSLQFPNRFLGWASCLMIFVMGYLFQYLLEHYKEIGYYVVLSITLFSTLSSIYMINATDLEFPRLILYTEESIGMGYISGGEYAIEGTDNTLQTYDIPRLSEYSRIENYQNKDLQITAHCTNLSDDPSYIDFPLSLYKGYQAKVINTSDKLPLSYGYNNQIRVTLPEGFDGDIEIKFVSPLYWRLAEFTSYLFLFIMLSRIIILRKGGKNEKHS